MKNRLNPLILALAVAPLLLNPGLPARADETNEAKPPPPRVEKKIFLFNGGGPLDFILAVDRHFRTRLGQILSIPSSLTRAEVPKMRITTDNPEDALQVYNHLQDPMLGEWRYEGPATNPSVLALVPDKQLALSKAGTAGAKVKALALAGVPESRWKDLQEDVQVAREAGMETARNLGGDTYAGNIHIQRESKILIASGSEGFIEMVESVVAAHRSNAQTETRTAAGTK
jgi:hypothetical protein